MIPAELIKKIRRIQIRTSHVVNEVLSGHYHSVFKGLGMEFEEVRQYQIGDDVRTIDWNVSARYGEPFVKIFREERELTVILVVDMSGSQVFGTQIQLKRELLAEVCATLAFSANRNNDKVGMIGFTDRIEKVVPARKGPRHILRVIRELLYHQPQGTGTDLGLALEHLNRVVKRKAVVFLASDFQSTGYEQPMRIARRRHDLIPIVIGDAREQELPNVGLIELRDVETGQRVLVDTSSRKVREAYRLEARRLSDERDQLFRRMNIDRIQIRTGEPFTDALTRFFLAREARR